MSGFHPLLVIPAVLVAIGCDKPGIADKARERAKEHALKLTEKANDSLKRIEGGDLSDLEGFRQRVRALRASLAAQDYSKAREYAVQIDKLLQTKIVAQSIEFLRIESTEGGHKAKAAVQDYMARNDLGEAETKAFREILLAFEQTNKQQRMELVS